MKTILKECQTCGGEFEAKLSEINRGNAKFCSRKCFAAHHSIKQKIHHEDNCSCSTCGVGFYRSPSKLKRSKSGFYFCSRKCKDEAQKIGGIVEIQPDHYGIASGRYSYREIAFEAHGKVCNDCGYEEIPECLEVHHIDTDRSHNDKENLVVLCPTCHQVRHYKEGTGRWLRKPPEVV